MLVAYKLNTDFSNFGSLKSTETPATARALAALANDFSNFGSLKSTETWENEPEISALFVFSNFGSLKSTETVGRGRWETTIVTFSNFGSLKSTETGEDDDRRSGKRVSAISAR